VKGNRKSTKIVEYQLICIDYRWICINYQALVLETFFCLSKRWLFLICDIILDYREALVFYRIFSTLVINFFEFLKFGSKSIEKSIENRYQSTSVTVNFTDNRDYRAVLYSMLQTRACGVDDWGWVRLGRCLHAMCYVPDGDGMDLAIMNLLGFR